MRPIEAVATMDRAFQQRRLLEGQSTLNVNSLSALVVGAAKDFAKMSQDGEKNVEAKDGKINGSEGAKE
ncbi:MAG: hypothetical protein A2W10_10910 [Deltaproteobacteria bacterium RBG_16_55_12]|nr:MAG: hypothetical protein A2W10_10910 [Deltaproteobacteria bacterium RBG_16_55_12]